MKNYKSLGEIGEQAVIGKLARLGIDVALPMSDNLPFDLIVIGAERLFKVQVKSSSQHINHTLNFGIKNSNFYRATSKPYTEQDCDLLFCYDLLHDNVYVLQPHDFLGKGTFTIYLGDHPQMFSHVAKDYLLDADKVWSVFGVQAMNWEQYANRPKTIKALKFYDHICCQCQKRFTSGRKRSKFCSKDCWALHNRKIARPTKEALEVEISSTSVEGIGRKYGVSGSAIRKWAKCYGLSTPKPHHVVYDGECQHCKRGFVGTNERARFCSHICASLANRKVNRPNDEMLMQDLAVMSMTKMGLKYGVSRGAIRKWVKTLKADSLSKQVPSGVPVV